MIVLNKTYNAGKPVQCAWLNSDYASVPGGLFPQLIGMDCPHKQTDNAHYIRQIVVIASHDSDYRGFL